MAAIGMDAILANQSPVTTAVKSDKTEVMGKQAFFNLLVKQLQYQDPLSPMENTEFTGQLAQFSTLETLSNMDKNLEQFSSMQASINNIQSLSFIGKHVNAAGNIIRFSGEDVKVNFKLDDRAAEARLKIYTDDGSLVRTVLMKDLPEGSMEYTWNGKDDSGEDLSSGRYRFTIEAADYTGQNVGATSYTTGEVTGVRYDEGVTYLIIGDKEVAIADIEKIEG